MSNPTPNSTSLKTKDRHRAEEAFCPICQNVFLKRSDLPQGTACSKRCGAKLSWQRGERKQREIGKKPCRVCGLLERNKNGGCKPCNSRRSREYYARDPERSLKQSRDRVTRNHEYHLWLAAKRRAKATGTEFSLTLDSIKIPDVCPVLGIPLARGESIAHDGSPSLDRIVPSLGYTNTNVRVIFFRSNRLKQDATLSELEALIAYIRAEVYEVSSSGTPASS